MIANAAAANGDRAHDPHRDDGELRTAAKFPVDHAHDVSMSLHRQELERRLRDFRHVCGPQRREVIGLQMRGPATKIR